MGLSMVQFFTLFLSSEDSVKTCFWQFPSMWMTATGSAGKVEALERFVSLSKPIRARVMLALRESTKEAC